MHFHMLTEPAVDIDARNLCFFSNGWQHAKSNGDNSGQVLDESGKDEWLVSINIMPQCHED